MVSVLQSLKKPQKVRCRARPEVYSFDGAGWGPAHVLLRRLTVEYDGK